MEDYKKIKGVTFIVEDYSGFQAVGSTSKLAITINLTDEQLKELSDKMGKWSSINECYANYDLSENRKSNVK